MPEPKEKGSAPDQETLEELQEEQLDSVTGGEFMCLPPDSLNPNELI